MNKDIMKLNDVIVTRSLKDDYMPAIRERAFNNAGALSEMFGKWEGFGKEINMPTGKKDIHYEKGRHASVGAFGDDETFDHADGRTVGFDGVIRARGFQANARLDKLVLERLQTPQAILNVFDKQFEDLAKAASKEYSRMLYGNGDGVIAHTSSAGTATTYIDGVTGAHRDAVIFSVDNIARFQQGDIITIEVDDSKVSALVKANPAGQEVLGKKAGEAGVEVESNKNRGATYGTGKFKVSAKGGAYTGRIAAVDTKNGKLILHIHELYDEFDKTVIPGATTIVTAKNIYNRRSKNQDIHGLEYIIKDEDDTASGIYGIGETNWGDGLGKRPMELMANKGAVTNYIDEYVFEEMCDRVELKGDDWPDFMVTTKAMRRSIASTNQGATQGVLRVTREAAASAANDARTMGYGRVDIKGDTIETDRMAPKNKLWFLSIDSFEIANTRNLDFNEDMDGKIWHNMIKYDGAASGVQFAQRTLSYEANMYGYRELVCMNPGANGLLEITTPMYNQSKFTNMVPVNEFGEAISKATPTDGSPV